MTSFNRTSDDRPRQPGPRPFTGGSSAPTSRVLRPLAAARRQTAAPFAAIPGASATVEGPPSEPLTGFLPTEGAVAAFADSTMAPETSQENRREGAPSALTIEDLVPEGRPWFPQREPSDSSFDAADAPAVQPPVSDALVEIVDLCTTEAVTANNETVLGDNDPVAYSAVASGAVEADAVAHDVEGRDAVEADMVASDGPEADGAATAAYTAGSSEVDAVDLPDQGTEAANADFRVGEAPAEWDESHAALPEADSEIAHAEADSDLYGAYESFPWPEARVDPQETDTDFTKVAAFGELAGEPDATQSSAAPDQGRAVSWDTRAPAYDAPALTSLAAAPVDSASDLDALVRETAGAERAIEVLEAVARLVRSREIVVTVGAGASAGSVLASILASLLRESS